MSQFHRFLLITSACLCPLALFADQITLKNGDRLTGSITKTDGANLIFKSELAGQITVPLDAVVSLTTSVPVNISLKDGQLLLGTASADAAKIAVTTAAGQLETPRADVTAIRSVDEQKAYQAAIDRYANPGILDLWAGHMDLGLALANGNANTFNFAAGFNAVRATNTDKITVNFASIYSTATVGGISSVTANAKRGSLDYNINLKPKLFLWAGVDLENDHFQQLELRFVPAAGFGYHVFKTKTSYLDVLGGGSLDREFYSTFNRTSGEVVFGDDYDKTINKRTHIHQNFKFFENLSYSGQYRVNFDLSAATTLTKMISLQFTGSERYVTNPPPGLKGNDLILTTGVRLSFARQ
jgi:hypothetical protein